MPEIKHTFQAGKMNKDLDERLVPQGEYRDALNIEVRTSDGGDVGTVQNLYGNLERLSYNNVTDPINPTINWDGTKSYFVGSIADEKTNNSYFFVASPPISINVDYSTVLENKFYKDMIIKYNSDTRTIKPVLTDIFRIELTVGKMARARNGKGAPAGTTADPSPFGDAAKIYIADMTNADTNFGFCGAQLGTVNANSAVVSFADQIRIFGLGGVQISTGHPKNAKGFGLGGITNCLGGTVPKAPPIVLSAGNQDGFYEHAISPGDGTLAQNLKIEMVPIIQGVAKGYNTTQCIVKLSEIIDGILSALMRLSTFQGAFFATTSIQIPPPINPHIPAAANMMIQENFESFMTTLTSLRVEIQVWEATYTGFRAPKAIESPNVFTS